MLLRIDVEINQMTEGEPVPSPTLIAEKALEAVERIGAFAAGSQMYSIDKVDLVYNSAKDPNA